MAISTETPIKLTPAELRLVIKEALIELVQERRDLTPSQHLVF